MYRAVVSVGARLIEGEREVLSLLQRAGVPAPVVGGGCVRGRPFVCPGDRRPRGDGDLPRIEGEILDRDGHIVLRRGGGSKTSKAAIESVARYSSRFKAPPYASCFRPPPQKGACTLQRRQPQEGSRGLLIDTPLHKDGAASLLEPEDPKEARGLIGHSQPWTMVAAPSAGSSLPQSVRAQHPQDARPDRVS